jgi:hypothetical protein
MTNAAQRHGRRPRLLLTLEPLEDRQLLSNTIGVSAPESAGSSAVQQHALAGTAAQEYGTPHAAQTTSPRTMRAAQYAPVQPYAAAPQHSAAQSYSDKGLGQTASSDYSPNEYATPATPTLTPAEEEAIAATVQAGADPARPAAPAAEQAQRSGPAQAEPAAAAAVAAGRTVDLSGRFAQQAYNAASRLAGNVLIAHASAVSVVVADLDAFPQSQLPGEEETGDLHDLHLFPSAAPFATQSWDGPAGTGAPLTGQVAFDLPAFEKRLDEFFTRLGHLGTDLAAAPLFVRLTPWVVVVGVATAGLEVVRRQMRKQRLHGPVLGNSWRDPRWAWLRRQPVLPPLEES